MSCPAKDFWRPEVPQLLDCPRRLEWQWRERTAHTLGSQPAWAHVGEKQDRIEDHDQVTDRFGGRSLQLSQRK